MLDNFNKKHPALIGAVHVKPLPGAADFRGAKSIDQIVDEALQDAETYLDGGADGIILENMHDLPYLRGRVEPETTAAMTRVAVAIRQRFTCPIGVQLLAAANREALAVAIAAELDFLRVEGFVFAHIGDEGLHQSCAPELIRLRAALGAQHIKIYADIKKKHSAHAITEDLSLEETAHAAEFFKADGVIVTGLRTADAPAPHLVHATAGAVKIPVLIGSGITPENLDKYKDGAAGYIVGTYAKKNGNWQEPVVLERVKKLKASLLSM